VNGFLKRGLPHTSSPMNLEDELQTTKKTKKISIYWLMLVLTTVRISRQWLYLIWSYQPSKMVKWMCVEDAFLQIWSHMYMHCIAIFFYLKLLKDSNQNEKNLQICKTVTNLISLKGWNVVAISTCIFLWRW